MVIREITNKEEWEGFLEKCVEKTFLQSWNWGEFNLGIGCKIWRFGIYNNENLIAIALVVKVIARRGTFLLIPHGPVLLSDLTGQDKKEIFKLILEQLRSDIKTEKVGFVRISPILEDNQENRAIFEDLGFRYAPMHSSAYEATWKLDIYPDEQKLLADMRKTTRYLIKKVSENSDISIEITSDYKNVEIYQKLNKEVARRQKFVAFSDEFIKKEFEIFSKNGQALFLFGKYKGEVVCGALIIFWQNISFYHQAASLGKFAKFSVPYLLQWEAIKEAKRRGCAVYDFWGFTDPEIFPRHPWAGPSLFKMGFGGYKKEYVKTQDFIISWRYWINYIIEIIRKKRRGL